jgi:hypothetical protein
LVKTAQDHGVRLRSAPRNNWPFVSKGSPISTTAYSSGSAVRVGNREAGSNDALLVAVGTRPMRLSGLSPSQSGARRITPYNGRAIPAKCAWRPLELTSDANIKPNGLISAASHNPAKKIPAKVITILCFRSQLNPETARGRAIGDHRALVAGGFKSPCNIWCSVC